MPWQSLWTSSPVFALVLACCAQHWGLWTIMTMMPIYLSQAYNVEIDLIGVIIAASYFAMFLMVFPFQCASDSIIKRKHLSATVTRKIFNTIGFVGPAVCLIAMVYIATDLKVTASLLILFMALNAGQYSGFMCSHEEMAPNFSNILKRTTVGFADVVSIFAPLIAGVMLEDHSDLSDWRYVFNLSAALYLTGGVFYIAFGTSMKQKWNDKDFSIVEEGAEENK